MTSRKRSSRRRSSRRLTANKASGLGPLSDPSFRRWFGHSKVVDVNREPLIVYHGTSASFDTFNPRAVPVNDDGYRGAGSYFISRLDTALQYAEMAVSETGGMPPILAVYLSIQNPYDARKNPTPEEIGMDREEILAWTDNLIKLGYDGVHADHGGLGEEWVAFSPTQIKHARMNDGDYDSKNPNIYKNGRRR